MWKAILLIAMAAGIMLGCAGDGADGSDCSVKEVDEGALVTCDDGTQTLVSNGTDGADGTDGQNGTDGESCQTPPSTFHMASYKFVATEEFDRWMEDAEKNYEGCPENGTADTEEECTDNYLSSKYSAHRYYAIRGNLFPEHECGATVMDIVTTIDEYVAEDGLYGVWHPSKEDSDGDGISNYHEYFMGMNPCYPQSFGCKNDADGDFDFDGILNGEDSHPYCPEDASYWPAECI